MDGIWDRNGFGDLHVWGASTRRHFCPASLGQSLKSMGALSFPGRERGMDKRQGSHRAGQLGKVLPGKLNHIPYPQDGAEWGLFRVEAACLYVLVCQVGQEVSPGEERGKR